jgi:hypothetical protein
VRAKRMRGTVGAIAAVAERARRLKTACQHRDGKEGLTAWETSGVYGVCWTEAHVGSLEWGLCVQPPAIEFVAAVHVQQKTMCSTVGSNRKDLCWANDASEGCRECDYATHWLARAMLPGTPSKCGLMPCSSAAVCAALRCRRPPQCSTPAHTCTRTIQHTHLHDAQLQREAPLHRGARVVEGQHEHTLLLLALVAAACLQRDADHVCKHCEQRCCGVCRHPFQGPRLQATEADGHPGAGPDGYRTAQVPVANEHDWITFSRKQGPGAVAAASISQQCMPSSKHAVGAAADAPPAGAAQRGGRSLRMRCFAAGTQPVHLHVSRSVMMQAGCESSASKLLVMATWIATADLAHSGQPQRPVGNFPGWPPACSANRYCTCLGQLQSWTWLHDAMPHMLSTCNCSSLQQLMAV